MFILNASLLYFLINKPQLTIPEGCIKSSSFLILNDLQYTSCFQWRNKRQSVSGIFSNPNQSKWNFKLGSCNMCSLFLTPFIWNGGWVCSASASVWRCVFGWLAMVECGVLQNSAMRPSPPTHPSSQPSPQHPQPPPPHSQMMSSQVSFATSTRQAWALVSSLFSIYYNFIG